MNPHIIDFTHSAPWALWFAGWCLLNLVPFSIAGGVLLVAEARGGLSRRFLTWVTCVVLLVMVCNAYLSAAEVYDQCTDPAYINTWWWYVWGCYLR